MVKAIRMEIYHYSSSLPTLSTLARYGTEDSIIDERLKALTFRLLVDTLLMKRDATRPTLSVDSGVESEPR